MISGDRTSIDLWSSIPPVASEIPSAFHGAPTNQRLRTITLDMAKAMLGARERFLGILSRTADRVAAEDEFNRSVRALAGAAWEVARHRPPRIDHLAVFLPSNNVLYSCVLFGLIPSLYCDSIEMRPSSRVKDASRKVIELLRETCRPWISDRIRLIDLSQRAFTETCSCADAVIFTGQYENGVELMSRLSDKPLFLMFNSGPNPMIIGPQATPETTLRSLLISRLYNSGQDCLCADLVYVHRSILRGSPGSFRRCSGPPPTPSPLLALLSTPMPSSKRRLTSTSTRTRLSSGVRPTSADC
ncbi:aldehyde dehydrogenase family protein [Actinomadura sp. J1-007]|nr:aldehyde dehydrogenase family protein [Actinomadura sp. J1-007]